MADFAYQAIHDHFIDFEYGGVYWTVCPDGTSEISKKQVYGEAFALYGLSEYTRALYELRPNLKQSVTSEDVFKEALHTYDLLEAYCRDTEYGGYWEARARDWKQTTDLKLSPKDIDCDKSMNTNLHILEALSTWYRTIQICHPENTTLLNKVQNSLKDLVQVTISYIVGKDGHLDLYFTGCWEPIGEDYISYGHDIEASWLLWEAAEALNTPDVYAAVKPIVLNLAEVSFQEGFDQDTGALDNEFHRGHRDTTRIWWCQAEALIGYVTAYQITGDERWLHAAVRIQKWIETYQVDHTNGDWFQAVSREGLPDLKQEKGGNWKTSYHNGRCCMELLRRSNCDSYRL
jgi:mannobiose 2-epimerase